MHQQFQPRNRQKRLQYFAVPLSAMMLMAACSGDPAANESEEVGDQTQPEILTIQQPIVGNGASEAIPVWYMIEEGLDTEYGFDIEVRQYNSIQAYYTGLSTGEWCIGTGAPDGISAQAAAGAPITTIGTRSPMMASIVTNEAFEWEDPTSLAGHRFVGIQGSGTFRLVQSVLEDLYDVSFDSDLEVVSASSQIDGPTSVAAGTADAALTWEPSSSQAVARFDNLRVAYDVGDDYAEQTGNTLWQFTMHQNTDCDLSDDDVDRFIAMWRDAADQLQANPEEADAIAVDNGYEPGVVAEAISSGRMAYDVRPISDEIVAELQDQMERTLADSALSGDIPETFWGSS